MKNRVELVKTLGLVGRALADNDILPVWQNFLFNGTTVMAYNDAIGIKAHSPHTPQHQAFAVHGRTLLGLLSNCAADTVSISLDKSNFHIKSGRSTFKLGYVSRDDYPFEEPENKWDTRFSITPDLIAGLQACLVTSSKDHSQPALMGVCLNQTDEMLRLHSCDGDVMTTYYLNLKCKGDNYTLSNAFCEAVVAIYEDTGASSGWLEVDDQWAKVSFDTKYIVYGRMLERNNPLDHEALFKDTLDGKEPEFRPVPEGLNEALSQARVITDPESAATTLTVGNGRLLLLSETHMGTVRGSVAFDGHPDVEANVSASLIHRTLKSCQEMAILDNCCILSSGNKLRVLISNLG